MDTLDGFEELAVDKEKTEIRIPVMHVELALNVRYFLNGAGIGYCGLLINGVNGKGLRGCVEAAAAKSFVGRTIFVFLSELEGGKKLITVPALFEKEPSFDGKVDLSDLIIKTYYHDEFKKTAQEVYKEHMNALMGKKVCNDKDCLCRSIRDLPAKGIEILKSYR
ncbi:MAG: hypothetical protein O8C66_06550 [Candidatus Methanoperedens sp.]|nr:hypothetical protein [Candidatus Methanoperedens sp.]MCZ7370151.1 hypothetical protein [Candidatus Methanoperedens sp.]